MFRHLTAREMLKQTYGMRLIRKAGPESISRQARQRLAAVVRLAADKSAFYRERYKGIDLDNARLCDLPPFDKHEFMHDLQSTFAVDDIDADEAHDFVQRKELIGSLYKGKYILAHTSGSTGLRGLFVQDLWGWTIGHSLLAAKMGSDPNWRHRVSLRMRPPWRVAVIIPTEGHYTSLLVPKISPALRDLVSRIHYINILDPIDRIIDQLNKAAPIWLHSYPTVMTALVKAQEEGELKIQPLFITTGSEPFTRAARQLVSRTWPRALVNDVYASTEVLPIARECAHGTLHLMADWVIVEPVDDSGEPVAQGEASHKIYITHLFNRVQPLIRYEMTDSVRFLDKKCPCGMHLPAIEVTGRTNDTLYIKAADGHMVTLLPTPILVAFMEVPDLKQYQLIHEEPARIVVRYTVDRAGDADRVAGDIRKVFGAYLEHHHVGGQVGIEPLLVDEIERDQRTHKILQVINKVGSNHGE